MHPDAFILLFIHREINKYPKKTLIIFAHLKKHSAHTSYSNEHSRFVPLLKISPLKKKHMRLSCGILAVHHTDTFIRYENHFFIQVLSCQKNGVFSSPWADRIACRRVIYDRVIKVCPNRNIIGVCRELTTVLDPPAQVIHYLWLAYIS